MRTRIALGGAAVLAALLVTAGVAGALSAGGAPGQAQVQNQGAMSDTITVGGNGQVQAQADRAVIRVGVLATGDEISTVRNQLSENATSMREALTSSGIDSSQIRTNYYDISSEERYRGPEREGPKYRGTHSFTITIEDPETAGEVIDTAVSNGASEVDGVEFTLSPEKREQLREDALETAMENARSEAGTVAAAEDLQIAGVDRISTTEFDRRPYRAEAAAFADGGNGATSINSGPVTVRASVTVVYETNG